MAANTAARCSTPFLQAKQSSVSASLPGSLSLHRAASRRGSAASVQAKATSRRHLVAAAEVAAEASAATSSAPGDNWVPLIPIETLPKGERRLVSSHTPDLRICVRNSEGLQCEAPATRVLCGEIGGCWMPEPWYSTVSEGCSTKRIVFYTDTSRAIKETSMTLLQARDTVQ